MNIPIWYFTFSINKATHLFVSEQGEGADDKPEQLVQVPVNMDTTINGSVSCSFYRNPTAYNIGAKVAHYLIFVVSFTSSCLSVFRPVPSNWIIFLAIVSRRHDIGKKIYIFTPLHCSLFELS